MSTIRLFLIDPEQKVRHGLRMRLEMEPDLRVIGEAGDGPGALREVARVQPDLVLMDIEMPGEDGIGVAAELMARSPECAVVIVSMRDDPVTRARARAAGVAGFVSKHEIDGVLTGAIRSAHAGSRFARKLSDRREEPGDADPDEREQAR